MCRACLGKPGIEDFSYCLGLCDGKEVLDSIDRCSIQVMNEHVQMQSLFSRGNLNYSSGILKRVLSKFIGESSKSVCSSLLLS